MFYAPDYEHTVPCRIGFIRPNRVDNVRTENAFVEFI